MTSDVLDQLKENIGAPPLGGEVSGELIAILRGDPDAKRGWEEAPIASICVVEYGTGLRVDERSGSGYPVVASGGVIGLHEEPYVNEPCIVIGRKGNVGTIQLFEGPCTPIDTTFFIRQSSTNCDFKYFYYLLCASGLENKGSDSAVPGLNRDTLKETWVNLPPLHIQKQIADLLCVFDEKIELLRAQNKTLESIAQAIYKRWFVDFEFPMSEEDAKALGKLELAGQPYKSSGGKMKPSELGDIPENWSINELRQLAKVEWGNTSLTKASYVEDGKYLAVSAKGCDGRIDVTEHEFGTFVISAIGENCGRLFFPMEAYTAIKNTMAIAEYDSDLSIFSYLFLKTFGFQRRGAAQPFISKGDTEKTLIALPVESVLAEFRRVIGPQFLQMQHNEASSIGFKYFAEYLRGRLI